MLFHTLQHVALSPLLQKAIVFGGSGVHLFFLLSGFGLGLSKSTFNTANFYKRRMLKVWLPYVLILTISLGFAYGINLFKDRLPEYLGGVFLYTMFREDFIESFGGHFWFISAIMQFYLVYPIFVWLKNQCGKQLWAFFGIALLASLLWWEFVYMEKLGGFRIWNSFFLQFTWEFILGMALATAYQSREKLQLGFMRLKGDFWDYTWWAYLPVALFFTGIMIVMILKMGEIGKIFNDIPTLIGYSALSIFIYHIGDRFLPFVKKFFLWISTFSFSLYLSHLLVLVLYLRGLETLDISPNVLTLLPFVGLALLVGRLFEPLSQWWVRSFESLFFSKKEEKPRFQPEKIN